MSTNRTLPDLLGTDVEMAASWRLRVLCRDCGAWRSVHISRLDARYSAKRMLDVVACLACSACNARPDAVWLELRAAYGNNRLIARHEVLRTWAARGEEPPEVDGPTEPSRFPARGPAGGRDAEG